MTVALRAHCRKGSQSVWHCTLVLATPWSVKPVCRGGPGSAKFKTHRVIWTYSQACRPKTQGPNGLMGSVPTDLTLLAGRPSHHLPGWLGSGEERSGRACGIGWARVWKPAPLLTGRVVWGRLHDPAPSLQLLPGWKRDRCHPVWVLRPQCLTEFQSVLQQTVGWKMTSEHKGGPVWAES